MFVSSFLVFRSADDSGETRHWPGLFEHDRFQCEFFTVSRSSRQFSFISSFDARNARYFFHFCSIVNSVLMTALAGGLDDAAMLWCVFHRVSAGFDLMMSLRPLVLHYPHSGHQLDVRFDRFNLKPGCQAGRFLQSC
jgi:hypothetical protein